MATLRARGGRGWRLVRLGARNGARLAASRVHRRFRPSHRRGELDARYAVRTAHDVAAELGQMKGLAMKLGQMASFILESLPPDAQGALAVLQADAPPMAPSLAAGVVAAELGDPDRVFLDWAPEPTAAASVGQVHRAVTRQGERVAVKVQYPGAGTSIGADLDNAQVLYSMAGLTLKGLDTRALVDELRVRMAEELDYAHEARNQRVFATAFEGHPAVRVPRVVDELSTSRVLTTAWVDGDSWAEFTAHADAAARARAGEVVWRFAQAGVHHVGAFNGDPHPGNYKFHPDGTVTFLDFGLVKRWSPGEWEGLRPTLEALIVHRDADALVGAMERGGFLAAGDADHLRPDEIFHYVSAPYEPYLVDSFRFTREWMRATLARVSDVRGRSAPVVRRLNLPPSFVILDRVVWGVSAILGKLEVERPWRAMLLEYLDAGPPATDLGAAEQAWALRRGGWTRSS